MFDLELAENETIIREYELAKYSALNVIVTNKRIVRVDNNGTIANNSLNVKQCFIENIHSIDYGKHTRFNILVLLLGIILIAAGIFSVLYFLGLEYIGYILIGIGIFLIIFTLSTIKKVAFMNVITTATNKIINIETYSANKNFIIMINEITALILDIKYLDNANLIYKWLAPTNIMPPTNILTPTNINANGLHTNKF